MCADAPNWGVSPQVRLLVTSVPRFPGCRVLLWGQCDSRERNSSAPGCFRTRLSGRRVPADRPSVLSWLPAGWPAGTCARERRHDLGPGAALWVDQVEMAGPGYLDQRARGKSPAHFDRHLLIGGFVGHSGGGGGGRGRGGGGGGDEVGGRWSRSVRTAAADARAC